MASRDSDWEGGEVSWWAPKPKSEAGSELMTQCAFQHCENGSDVFPGFKLF